MRVAVIGTGLIGGSIALALSGAEGVDEVVVSDLDPKVADAAVRMGAGDRAAPLAAAGESVDVIVVSTPPSTVADVATRAAERARTGAIVTDCGSTKGRIVATTAKRMPGHVTFIGGHPMAGSEVHGLSGARRDMFRDATWVLTPTYRSDPDAVATLERLWSAVGAHVITLDPFHHDRLVAVVSHLPHLVAGTLLNLAAERSEDADGLFLLAAGGFRDMTRVAGGRPGIWLDICEENSSAIVDVLDAFILRLRRMRDAIALDDRDELLELLDQARSARGRIPTKPKMQGRDLVELVVTIADRPRALAEVAAIVGDAGVNIEDFRIAHSAEGGAGGLVLVTTVDHAEVAMAALAEAGYVARMSSL